MDEIELVSEVGVTLIEASASDDMVAMAAWVSHDADNEKRLENRAQVTNLINFLYSNKHMSPFEHGHFTFKIDVPLFVAREFMRHRTASYNEVSGRYTVMQPRFWVGDIARVQKGKPGDYYFEPADNEQTAIYLQSKRKAATKAWKIYQQRLDAGIAKEQAREDLPLSLMTQFYVTMNPRNLMQFLTLRNEKHALAEIQAVAVKMEEIFAEVMPLTYLAYAAGRDNERIDVVALRAEVEEQKKTIKMLKLENKILGESIKQKEKELDSFRRAKLDIEAKYRELENSSKKEDLDVFEAAAKFHDVFIDTRGNLNIAAIANSINQALGKGKKNENRR